jgi:D-alanine-D-alanine ligase
MKLLILHTLPPDHVPDDRRTSEFDLSPAVEGLLEVLPEARAVGIRGEVGELLAALDEHQPDVVFNLCEAPLAQPELEAHAAALLEWLGVPFTGSGSTTLALCRRKDLTASVLRAAGVLVPADGGFPCIVKPRDEDGSAGIAHDSLCDDAASVERRRRYLATSVLVQKYLPGPEFTVSLWGQRDPEHIAIGAGSFVGSLRIVTYAAKWDVDSVDYNSYALSYDAHVEAACQEAVAEAARRAWRALGVRGYARVDIRLDAAGQPHVIDVNPNPELSPDVGIHRAVTETGWSWERFARSQIAWALGEC